MWRSPVSVHVWGACGRGFKSRHPDISSPFRRKADWTFYFRTAQLAAAEGNKKDKRREVPEGLLRRDTGHSSAYWRITPAQVRPQISFYHFNCTAQLAAAEGNKKDKRREVPEGLLRRDTGHSSAYWRITPAQTRPQISFYNFNCTAQFAAAEGNKKDRRRHLMDGLLRKYNSFHDLLLKAFFQTLLGYLAVSFG